MIETVQTVGYGRPASDALAAGVAAAKRGAPLAPVTVVVPSNFAGLAARRLLGSSTGIANVAFLTPFRLAELLASDLLLDRHPLTNPVLGAAVRLALADDPGPFLRVSDHVATETALAALYAELSDLSPNALQALSGSGDRAARTAARFHEAIAARLGAFHGERDVVDAAAGRDDLDHLLEPFGHVIWFLPEATTLPMSRFVGAVLAAAPSSVIVGSTGVPSADAAVWRTCERAGVTPTTLAAPADAPATADHIISVTDADEEVRAVVRAIARLAEAGTPLDRIAVFHPTPTPYVGILEQQLAAADIPANGPSRRRLRDSVAGRTVLAALALPAQRWRRDRVLALASDAPVRHHEHQARPSAWEAISRDAGVVSDLRDWHRRLDSHLDRLTWKVEHLVGDDAARMDAQITDVRALRAFVDELADDVAAVDRADGWAAKSAAVRDLLSHLLGEGHTHQHWPEAEQQGYERVESVLTRLAMLDDLEPSPSPEVFARALAAELDVGQGRTGRFGEGVLYAPLASAVGHDLDAVFVLGCSEGILPVARRDDTMLPDAARSLTDGELELRSERMQQQHRQFLAALATAPVGGRTLTFARGDLRSGRRSQPSRWLLDTASALERTTVHTTDFHLLGAPTVDVVASHATGTITASTHGSVGERDVAEVAAADRSGIDVLDLPTMAAVRRGVEAQRARRSSIFTEWDGNLAGQHIPANDDRPWSPTRLETWADCGFKYYLGYVLGLTERDEPERVVDLTPLDRGSGVHLVLERFLAEVIAAGAPDPTQPWTDAHYARIAELAAEVFGDYERRGRTGRPVHWRLTRDNLALTLAAFLAADDAHRADSGARPTAVEFAFGTTRGGRAAHPPATIDLASGRTLTFGGMIDRVDVTDEGSHLVTDYKTGKGRKYKKLDDDPVRHGTVLQLGVYAQAARQHLDATIIDTHYWMVDLAGQFQRHGYRWTAAHQERFIEVVSAIIDGIDVGAFPAEPGEWNNHFNTHENCTYCQFDRVCTRDRGEQAAAKHESPELRVRDRLIAVEEAQ